MARGEEERVTTISANAIFNWKPNIERKKYLLAILRYSYGFFASNSKK